MKKNKIIRIHSEAFKNLSKLEEIDLSQNSIQAIELNMFSGSFDCLRRINFQYNFITRFLNDIQTEFSILKIIHSVISKPPIPL